MVSLQMMQCSRQTLELGQSYQYSHDVILGCSKGGGGWGEERVTAHPGCGPGEMVGLCLNTYFSQSNCEVFKWVAS